MILVTPADRPFAIPDEEPMVAIPGRLLVHVPPGELGSVYDPVPPMQKAVGPDMDPGSGLTVSTAVVVQFAGEYE